VSSCSNSIHVRALVADAVADAVAGSVGGRASTARTVETTGSTLSANPELLDETWSTQRGRSYFPSLRAAHRILARGYALEREIARYE
jgi:hypothetical protein